MTAEREDEINRVHREKMERRQAARRRVLATKTEERGLLIVHTGAGKGKSTAAFGMVLRAIAAAHAAWDMAQAMLADPSYRLVLFDELNIVLRYGYLATDDIVAALRA